jgi:2-keto-4-pentenoate hydratase
LGVRLHRRLGHVGNPLLNERAELLLGQPRMQDVANSATVRAAEMLMDEHSRRAQFRPFASAFEITDTRAAYSVQREFVRLQMNNRCTAAKGYKVGLTSPRMQSMCNIDSPIA